MTRSFQQSGDEEATETLPLVRQTLSAACRGMFLWGVRRDHDSSIIHEIRFVLHAIKSRAVSDARGKKGGKERGDAAVCRTQPQRHGHTGSVDAASGATAPLSAATPSRAHPPCGAPGSRGTGTRPTSNGTQTPPAPAFQTRTRSGAGCGNFATTRLLESGARPGTHKKRGGGQHTNAHIHTQIADCKCRWAPRSAPNLACVCKHQSDHPYPSLPQRRRGSQKRACTPVVAVGGGWWQCGGEEEGGRAAACVGRAGGPYEGTHTHPHPESLVVSNVHSAVHVGGPVGVHSGSMAVLAQSPRPHT